MELHVNNKHFEVQYEISIAFGIMDATNTSLSPSQLYKRLQK